MPTPKIGRSIPANQFAVVKDRERNHIVHSGTYEDMLYYAEMMNREYQSTAYVAELWEPNIALGKN